MANFIRINGTLESGLHAVFDDNTTEPLPIGLTGFGRFQDEDVPQFENYLLYFHSEKGPRHIFLPADLSASEYQERLAYLLGQNDHY